MNFNQKYAGNEKLSRFPNKARMEFLSLIRNKQSISYDDKGGVIRSYNDTYMEDIIPFGKNDIYYQ